MQCPFLTRYMKCKIMVYTRANVRTLYCGTKYYMGYYNINILFGLWGKIER